MTLRKKAFQGVKWTTIAAIINASAQLIQIAVLTRFLDKEDFGLMAIALFVIGISQIFLDMGLSNSIIYKQKVNSVQLHTLFWVNIFMGIGIFFILILLAPYIAIVYESPKLQPVIYTTAFTFLILPLGQLYETLLKKELQFKALAFRDIYGKLTGLVVGIGLAVMHFGVFSLVYANLATALVSMSLLVLNGLSLYKPKFQFSWKSLKQDEFISFGLFQMGENIVGYFNAQFDTLLIGKLLGMEALGMYNIAKQLAFKPYQIINPILTKVAFPILAKLQNEIARLRETYLNIIRTLTMTNAPIYMIMILWAKPLIHIFFGPGWESAIPIFQLLCITALCNSIGNPVGALQLAKGRADLGFYWNIGMFLFMPLSIWIGSFWGLMGVAWALTIFKVVVLFPAWRFFVYYLCEAKAGEYFWSIGKPILFTVISGFAGSLVLLLNLNNYFSIILGATVIMTCLLILNLKFNKGILNNFNGLME
jgi:O-antigen/teichoic acid export membrane protein